MRLYTKKKRKKPGPKWLGAKANPGKKAKPVTSYIAHSVGSFGVCNLERELRARNLVPKRLRKARKGEAKILDSDNSVQRELKMKRAQKMGVKTRQQLEQMRKLPLGKRLCLPKTIHKRPQDGQNEGD